MASRNDHGELRSLTRELCRGTGTGERGRRRRTVGREAAAEDDGDLGEVVNGHGLSLTKREGGPSRALLSRTEKTRAQILPSVPFMIINVTKLSCPKAFL